jgi:two-component system chemotaxis sensor kinase CheA
MQSHMDRFRETFFEEAAEHLANMESALLGLEHSPGDQELLNNIFRCAHTIKGASATFGLEEVAKFTHSLENLLDRMRAGTLDASSDRLDLLLRCSDILRGLLGSARDGEQPPPAVDEVLAELKGILGQEAKPATAPAEDACRQVSPIQQTYRVVFVPDRDILRKGMDPLLLLRDLSQTGRILDTKADLSRLPPLSELDPESCYLGWSVRLTAAQTPEQVAEVFAFVQDSSQVGIEVEIDHQGRTTDRGRAVGADVDKLVEPSSVPPRVSLTKAPDLIDMATDLVYAQARLIHTANDYAACLGDKR